ncbi:MAG: folate/biopterin family MFS transporter, partial [Nitrososphaeraceae archaeon]|nr:folate/biopterin family MFS transporter [Nitrososphaeraceae archaeon]
MFRQLKEIYGIKFLIYLVIIQLFGKGLLYGLVGSLVLPIYKLIGVDGLNYQLYATIAEIPWSLKPIFGVLSDLFIIGGYNKRYWVLFGNFIGSLFALILAIFFQTKNPILICFCFFAIELQVALQDLMTEAKYAEIMRKHPESGSSIVSFVNGLNSLGTFISVIIVGILADQQSYVTYTILFYVCFGITLFPILPTILGWLPEIKNNKLFSKTEEEVTEDDMIEANDLLLIQSYHKNKDIKKKIYALVFSIGIMSIVISVVFVFSTLAVTIITAVSLISGILLGYKVFDKIIMHAILYRCLTYLTYWGLSGAMDYFYTASNDCVPNGPHFSYEYYITWTGLVGAVVSFLGAFIYQALFGRSNIRITLVITTLISGLFSCFDLIIVKRW